MESPIITAKSIPQAFNEHNYYSGYSTGTNNASRVPLATVSSQPTPPPSLPMSYCMDSVKRPTTNGSIKERDMNCNHSDNRDDLHNVRHSPILDSNEACPLMANDMSVCAGCGQRITDKIVLRAIERFWHTDCLRCSCCRVSLNDVGHSFFTRGNMILCRKDCMRNFLKIMDNSQSTTTIKIT